MKSEKQPLSRQERQRVDRFIGEVCELLGLPRGERALSCGWEAFLTVYRREPAAFFGDGEREWKRAFTAMVQALEQERRQEDFWGHKCTSLDAPVSDEVQRPRIELLVAAHGDFVNSVCLHDYLRRMEKDARRLAFHLMRGDSLAEVEAFRRWPPARTRGAYNVLRHAMERYLAI